MTTAVAANSANSLPFPAFSWGPLKIQVMDISIISGDTAATATADRLSVVYDALLVAGVVQTAQPTVSANVATFAFTDPVATVKGKVLLLGK